MRLFGKTFFDWFGEVFSLRTETEGDGEDSRGFFRRSVRLRRGHALPMHATEVTVGDDSRMAVAAHGMESMPLGENADRVAEESVSTVTANARGNALVASCSRSVVGRPGMEPLVKAACGMCL